MPTLKYDNKIDGVRVRVHATRTEYEVRYGELLETLDVFVYPKSLGVHGAVRQCLQEFPIVKLEVIAVRARNNGAEPEHVAQALYDEIYESDLNGTANAVLDVRVLEEPIDTAIRQIEKQFETKDRKGAGRAEQDSSSRKGSHAGRHVSGADRRTPTA